MTGILVAQGILAMNAGLPKSKPLELDMISCRCGYAGTGTHLCHGRGYTCLNPGIQRFYDPQTVGLAGMQMKLQVTETCACDDCWAEFKPRLTG